MAFPSLIFAGALVVGALAAAPASAVTASPAAVTAAVASLCPDAVTATFGPDVCVFKPAMTASPAESRPRPGRGGAGK